MIQSPEKIVSGFWRSAEWVDGIGGVVVGAMPFDVVGCVAPAAECFRLLGCGSEVVEVGRRVGDVGVDELFDVCVDGALDFGQAIEFTTVVSSEGFVTAVFFVGPFECIVEAGETPGEVVGLMRKDDAVSVSILAVAPSVLGLELGECVLRVSEPFADVVALVRERVDLVAARWWACACCRSRSRSRSRTRLWRSLRIVWRSMPVSMARCCAWLTVSTCLNVSTGSAGCDFGCVGFWSWLGVDEVDAVLDAAAGEGDVAGFLVERVGAEYEGAVDGLSLCFVDGGRVGVADVAGVEVVGGEVE